MKTSIFCGRVVDTKFTGSSISDDDDLYKSLGYSEKDVRTLNIFNKNKGNLGTFKPSLIAVERTDSIERTSKKLSCSFQKSFYNSLAFLDFVW